MNIFPFASPWWFLLLLLIPIIIYLYINKYFKSKNYIKFSNIKYLKVSGGEVSKFKKHILFFLHILSILLIITALARPQFNVKTFVEVEGVDMILLLDLSRSMKFVDGINPNFEHYTRSNKIYFYDKYQVVPNRLQIAKKVLRDFIKKRSNDQLGLVGFAEYPLTMCPITLDHNILISYLEDISLEKIGALGDTAIGDGIGASVNSLKNSKANSKLIILLTDGNNNTGEKGPLEVAKIAKDMNIKIYTIGIGDVEDVLEPDETAGKGFYVKRPINHGERLDTNILKKISELTGARSYVAKNPQELEEIYEEINQLEKYKISLEDIQTLNEDIFQYFIGMALLLIILSLILEYTWLRRIP